MSAMTRITVVFALLGFLLLRPYQLERSGLVYASDDISYLSHATALAYGQFPSYAREKLCGGQIPRHSVGPGILAAPFVFAGSLLDRLEGSSVVNERTLENSLQSWSAYGFVASSVIYIWIALCLLFAGLRRFVSKSDASMAIILTLVQGVPLYAFRRPVFSHAGEFFIQSAFVYLFLSLIAIERKEQLKSISEKCSTGLLYSFHFAILCGVLSGLLVLVRYNNVAFALSWPTLLLVVCGPRDNQKRNILRLVVAFGIAASLIIIFKIIPTVMFGREQYDGMLKFFVRPFDPGYFFRRMFHILFGLDWGLIFTAPFALFGLLGFGRLAPAGLYDWFCAPSRRRTYVLLLLFCPLLVNVYVTVCMGSQGGWYGYRYLIFSLMPISVIGLAGIIQYVRKHSLKLMWAVILVSVFPLTSMLCFEGNNGSLTLSPVAEDQYFEWIDWDNPSYQYEVWRTACTPAQCVASIAKGGPAYTIALSDKLIGVPDHSILPKEVSEKYPFLSLKTFLRVLFLWLLPLLLLMCWCRLKNMKVWIPSGDRREQLI